MIRFASLTTILAALAAAPTAWSDAPFARAGEPHAVVSGSLNRPAQQLLAVGITDVDGRLTSRSQAVWLKPGRHTINAKGAVTHLGQTPGLRRSIGQHNGSQAIELDVEAGKTYWIALDTSDEQRDNWKLVNWRTEQTGAPDAND
ncbi:MAG: hypothetical protein LC637_10045 [Xanthomonadaceae bacterium]|nr:hypothetical protein [Xanthomonadaceae bacterium]